MRPRGTEVLQTTPQVLSECGGSVGAPLWVCISVVSGRLGTEAQRKACRASRSWWPPCHVASTHATAYSQHTHHQCPVDPSTRPVPHLSDLGSMLPLHLGETRHRGPNDNRMADSPGSAPSLLTAFSMCRSRRFQKSLVRALGRLCSAHQGHARPGQRPQARLVLAGGEGSLDTRPQDRTWTELGGPQVSWLQDLSHKPTPADGLHPSLIAIQILRRAPQKSKWPPAKFRYVGGWGWGLKGQEGKGDMNISILFLPESS